MQRRAVRRGKLSVFTYFLIFVVMVGVTALTIKELDIHSGIEEVLYQKDTSSSVIAENKYYINKIKNEYGITIGYGESEKNFMTSINANVQEDEYVANNNIKSIYEALKKYPSDVFDIFKQEKYSLYVVLVSNFTDNNLALASKNTLNQYRIFLSNNENFERAFHHEFFHVLVYYMQDKVKYLYHSWNSYNPTGFEYQADVSVLSNEYVYNKYATEEENENAYFVTKYSKVSPKEDRAEIFANLMMLNKKEGYLKGGSNIKNKIDYLINEIYENISVSNFHFSSYIN